jgi:hypothetical protein
MNNRKLKAIYDLFNLKMRIPTKWIKVSGAAWILIPGFLDKTGGKAKSHQINVIPSPIALSTRAGMNIQQRPESLFTSPGICRKPVALRGM